MTGSHEAYLCISTDIAGALANCEEEGARKLDISMGIRYLRKYSAAKG